MLKETQVNQGLTSVYLSDGPNKLDLILSSLWMKDMNGTLNLQSCITLVLT